MVYVNEISSRAKNIFGTSERPRLCVYRGNSNITAQIVDDSKGITIASASTKDVELKDYRSNIQGASKVGELLAQKAVKAGIKRVVFDRRNYIYHGKVKAVAEAARAVGLEF